ncbi:hypothetical protein [Tropicimonas sp. IMCC34043]|uniref:hypothetical protein n=1 Tax=Tropicimonas sp. IMCC34043 TaxID=2248760 RepID=UPI0013009351|nr:hypothetical protein [Tropicimonas sp. IMCC34043]
MRVDTTWTALTMALCKFAMAKTCEGAASRWAPNDNYLNGVEMGQPQTAARIETGTGDVTFFRIISANDVREHLNALLTQVARGVDGMMPVPWSREARHRGQMAETGTPVVTSDAWLPGAARTFVAIDNEAAGRREALLDKIAAFLSINRKQELLQRREALIVPDPPLSFPPTSNRVVEFMGLSDRVSAMRNGRRNAAKTAARKRTGRIAGDVGAVMLVAIYLASLQDRLRHARIET